ncbi:MAG: MMPL family transporter [Crocinitomicaceae bacterium]|nr:MMPL family transporter [Crocinitomicaceae bacterium]
MWHYFAYIILRFKFLILGIITLLTVFLGYEAAVNIKLDNKYGFILPKDSQADIDYTKFTNQFGDEGGSFVIAIQTDSLYTEDRLLKWKQLGDSILLFEGIDGVISEATLFNVENNASKQRFDARKIFSDTRYIEKPIDQIKEEVKRVPFYNGVLYNDSTNVSLMVINVQDDYLTYQKKANVVLKIKELAESYEQDFGKVRFSGLSYIRVIISKRIITEMYLFIALAIFATSFITFLFFRSHRVVLICNIMIGIGVIWSLGIIALLDYHLSVLMALIPPLMIVIGMPNCVFLMTHFHQEIKRHRNKIKALTKVIKEVGNATFITNFITAIGFFSLMYTNSDRLVEFGLVAGVTILLLFVLSICIFPIISTLTKDPSDKHLRHLDRGLAVLFVRATIYIVSKRRIWVYVATVVALVLSGIGMLRVKATGNITGDISEDNAIVQDIRFLEKNFGGSIPFEILVDYKSNELLFDQSTLKKVDEIQTFLSKDTSFSKAISIVDLIKAVNMAYYGNDPVKYTIFTDQDKKILKSYIENFEVTSISSSLQLKELLDTTNTTIRIRTQIKDYGSYEMSEKAEIVKQEIDSLVNPTRSALESQYVKVISGERNYIDSIINNNQEIATTLTTLLHVSKSQLKNHYTATNFNKLLRKSIDQSYLGITVTGTAVVAAEGTKYLIDSLFDGILFAVLTVSALMALLFRNWGIVLVSIAPNLIPLILTGGIMGLLNIPLKPSTLLVFNISFGITSDDSIHFLAKYRQELQKKKNDVKACILASLEEVGLSMFYTTIILFFGFSVFILSQFGGTQALGILVSTTLLFAISINLLLVPSILLDISRLIARIKRKKE